MIPLLFFALTLSGLIFILLVDYVRNRFRHTTNSRRVLLVETVIAVTAAAAGCLLFWPSASLTWRLAATMVIAPIMAVLMAFVTVETWRFRKQGGFDREITRLLRERNRYQEILERLIWELADLERQKESREAESQHYEVRYRALEDQLLAWEQSGGRNLRHSMLIEQWSAEFSGLTNPELLTRKAEAIARVHQSKGEERGEWAARANLINLTLLRRALSAPGGPVTELEQRLSQLSEARSRAEHRLDQIKRELKEWQERKLAFLREKIRLD